MQTGPQDPSLSPSTLLCPDVFYKAGAQVPLRHRPYGSVERRWRQSSLFQPSRCAKQGLFVSGRAVGFLTYEAIFISCQDRAVSGHWHRMLLCLQKNIYIFSFHCCCLVCDFITYMSDQVWLGRIFLQKCFALVSSIQCCVKVGVGCVLCIQLVLHCVCSPRLSTSS